MATLLSRPWVQTDSCIKTVQRHLDGVESIIVRQHFEMYAGLLCPVKPTKRTLPVFSLHPALANPAAVLADFRPIQDSKDNRSARGVLRGFPLLECRPLLGQAHAGDGQGRLLFFGRLLERFQPRCVQRSHTQHAGSRVIWR